jgi:DNA-binding cell septation regulator SpoVG
MMGAATPAASAGESFLAASTRHLRKPSDHGDRHGAVRIGDPRGGVELTDIRFSPASTRDLATGLLGYVALTVAGTLRLDGLTFRRTRAGRLTLAFPAPRSLSGRRRELVRPVDAAARERIERAVLVMVERELGTTA